MSKFDINTLPLQVIAYIKALEEKSAKLENENAKLENENTKLENENTKLEDRNAKLNATVQKQDVIIHNMNEMLVKGRKMMFGKSSEQLKYIDGSEQLNLFNEAEQEYNGGITEPTEETIVKEHTRKAKRTKEELTANLEHREVIIELEEEKKKCEICGTELTVIGKEKLRSELNIVPAQIFVIDYYRNVYKCKECEKKTDEAVIIKPDAPVPVMKKSMASPATVAYVMQEKYQNALPLFRQEQYWKSQGVELNRNTLANWIIRSTEWFKPLFELMKKELLTEDIINADETELRVLKRDGKPVDSMSRMWVFTSGRVSSKPMALYKYHPTRSAKVVTEMLGDYGGYLQTDGYAAYSAAEKATRIGCWAHARRKWTDCIPKGINDKNSKSAQALSLVEKIFAIEKGLESIPADKIYETRIEKSKPLLEEYWNLLSGIDGAGGSALAKAAAYSTKNKAMLEGFLLDGRLELTNNRAERAVKLFVIGRKNWLFSDTDKGADSSALCYSIIQSAKLNGLDVYGYLIYLLTELPKLGNHPDETTLRKMLPWCTLPEYCKGKRN